MNRELKTFSTLSTLFLPLFYPYQNRGETSCSGNSNVINISMYLTKKSKENLDNHLKEKLNLDSKLESNNIIIKSLATKNDLYIYEPLLTAPLAFRLKGIIRTSKGLVGFGRISSLIGEIKHNNQVAAILLNKSKDINQKELERLISLPTIINRYKYVDEKQEVKLDSGISIWKGRIPLSRMLPFSFNEEEIEIMKLPWNKQIVLDGLLCRSDLADEDGHCLLEQTEILKNADSNSQHEINEDQGLENTSQSLTDKPPDGHSECPVCVYMNNGECKEQFNSWMKCNENSKKNVDCEDSKVVLAKCMIQNEYYDIFVAKFS